MPSSTGTLQQYSSPVRQTEEKTIRLTMAQAIVKYLQVQYSERDGKTRRFISSIWGIFGHGNVTGLGQALWEYGHDLPFYKPCNEQAMVHAAAAYAKANLRLATFACSTSVGPGSTNMLTGAAGAGINRLPVLLLPADYYASRRQGPILQAVENPVGGDVSVNDCFRPLSRYFDRLSRPEQLLTALPEAMRVLTDPAETGVVTLALPQDVPIQAFDYPTRFFEKRIWPIERRLPRPDRIEEAIRILKAAKRPLIIAGGGVHYSEAWDELQAFSEAFGIPVTETTAGKGAIRNGSPLLVGGMGSNGTACAGALARDADLILALGTRLTDFITGSHTAFQHPDVKFLAVNVCGHDAYKNGAFPLLADVREALQALSIAGQEAGIKPNPDYLEEIAQLKQDWMCHLEKEVFPYVPGKVMRQAQLIKVLNEEAKPGDVVISAAGSPPGDLLQIWDASNDRKCHIEFGNSCMGYEIPAGLGVRMANPEGEVFVYVGDGGYLMNPTELVTAAQERLKITVVVSDNHGLQILRMLQNARAGHEFGNEFRERNSATGFQDGEYLKIDYAKIAEGMGARAWHVTTPDELRTALREARDEKRVCVIVAETDKDVFLAPSGVWWDFGVAEVSNDPVTRELRAKYEKDRAAQRFYY